MLRQKLDELTNDGAEAAARVSPWLPQRQASELLERLAATAAAGFARAMPPCRRRRKAPLVSLRARPRARGRRRRRSAVDATGRAATRRRRRPARPSAAKRLRRESRSRSRRRRRRARIRRPGRRRRAPDGAGRACPPTTLLDPLSSGDSAGAQLKMRVLVASWRQLRHVLAAKAAAMRQTEALSPTMRASRRWAARRRALLLARLSAARRDGARGRLPPAGGVATMRSCSVPASTRRGTTRRSNVATAAAAGERRLHAEEVALLSAKISMVDEENNELRARVGELTGDLTVLSQEYRRVLGERRATRRSRCSPPAPAPRRRPRRHDRAGRSRPAAAAAAARRAKGRSGVRVYSNSVNLSRLYGPYKERTAASRTGCGCASTRQVAC